MTKEQAIEYFGSVTALARALLISYQAVHGWRDSIPALRQLQIEMITGGNLKAGKEAYPELSPTLNQMMPQVSRIDQSGKTSGNPSSIEAT